MENLTPELRRRVLEAFDLLESNPRPPGAIALRAELAGGYRVRVGDYRIGYRVDDQARTVTVWNVGDRRHFYADAKRRRK
jgi:mRNA interferase RelE/StbE